MHKGTKYCTGRENLYQALSCHATTQSTAPIKKKHVPPALKSIYYIVYRICLHRFVPSTQEEALGSGWLKRRSQSRRRCSSSHVLPERLDSTPVSDNHLKRFKMSPKAWKNLRGRVLILALFWGSSRPCSKPQSSKYTRFWKGAKCAMHWFMSAFTKVRFWQAAGITTWSIFWCGGFEISTSCPGQLQNKLLRS